MDVQRDECRKIQSYDRMLMFYFQWFAVIAARILLHFPATLPPYVSFNTCGLATSNTLDAQYCCSA